MAVDTELLSSSTSSISNISATSVDSNPQPPSLDRGSSVVSSSSSSSSVVNPGTIRTYSGLGPLSRSGTPQHGNRPPAWLQRRFVSDTVDPAANPVKAPPSPAPSAGARLRMTSPDDFEFGEELGGGSWSTVMEAIYPPTQKRYAIKVLNKAQLVKEKMTQSAVVEKNALALLSAGDHPGIVRLYSAFHDPTSLYLVLSLAPNGDLRELTKRFGSLSLPGARYYIAQLVDTVQWIHSKGVLHRDLKPENVLLDENMRIKLTDFGSAYISKDNDLTPRSSTFVGTAAYVSPELLVGPMKTTSQSSDIWAIGCILYFLMVGYSPFLALNDYLSFKKIEALDYTFPEGFDPDAKDLVQQLLLIDPSLRLGIPPNSSPVKLREHPFFTGRDLSSSNGHPINYIKWDKLWSDPPVAAETGLVPPREREQDISPWEGFIHDFSLVSHDEPSSDQEAPLESNLPISQIPMDLPDTPQTPALSISQSDLQRTLSSASDPYVSAIHDQKPISDPGSSSDSPLDEGNPNTHHFQWSSVLSPSETVRLSAQVLTRSRRRLFYKTQRRVLAITTHSRLLCVKTKSSARIKNPAAPIPLVTKHAFTFPGPVTITPRKDEITDAQIKDQNILEIETSEGCFTYMFPNRTEVEIWIKEIHALIPRRNKD